jgi:hypothetical protein
MPAPGFVGLQLSEDDLLTATIPMLRAGTYNTNLIADTSDATILVSSQKLLVVLDLAGEGKSHDATFRPEITRYSEHRYGIKSPS